MELYVQNIKQLIELEVLEQKQLYMLMTVLDNRKKHDEYKKEKEIKIVQCYKSFEIFDEINFFLV